MMDVEEPMSDDENRNLFAEDERELEDESNNPEDYAVEVPATQGTQAGNMTANLDVSAVVKPKRVIKNPQPKLNPERLMGPRGLMALEEEFKDWKPRGDGHEFQDLDQILAKLNHWTHRLYPKLPFDDTLNVIENRLGNKKAVSTYVKKIRMDMVVPVRQETNDDQPSNDVNDDEVERYGEEPSQPTAEEEFESMASSTQTQRPLTQQSNTTTTLSDDQLERMRRNKEMAAQKKREREEKKRREQENMNRLTAEDIHEAEKDLAATATANNNRDDLELQLDEEEELMREMEENQREMEETRTRLDNSCNIDTEKKDNVESVATEASENKDDDELTLDTEAPPAAGEWSQEKEKSASSPGRELEPEPEKNPSTDLVNLDQIMEDMDDDL